VVRNNRWVTQPGIEEPRRPRRGGESRSVLVLMATTFTAAIGFVVAAVIIASVLGSSNVATVASVSGPVVARVDAQLVDINTQIDGGEGAAAGTGMVLTPSGVVLTNNHVIQEASSIEATDIGNGQTYAAKVIGYDERRDIAVLQLEGASGLASVTLGDSASVTRGGRIITIGNAGGVGGRPAARSGTVVALNQAITVSDDLDDSSEHLSQLIKVDGDLQPGDSGGPMVNASGAVVGMDTAASTSFQFSRQTTGEDFAIAIDAVKQIAMQIRDGRGSSAIHIGPTAFIGVYIASQPASNAAGAAVYEAIPNSAAASAGVRGGDVITSLGGRPVSSANDLTEALVPYRPGQRVTLGWLNGVDVPQSATITLGVGPAA
jgi:S1-C subfamily serine protease